MRVEAVWIVILVMAAVYITSDGTRSRQCTVKVGIIDMDDLMDHATRAWDYLVFQQHYDDVTLTFHPLSPRHRVTMNVLMEAFVDIGSGNISAIIGPYLPVAAIAARKFHIPYMVTEWDIRPYVLPDDVIVTLPLPDQLADVTVELAKAYDWNQIALLYDSHLGPLLVNPLTTVKNFHVRTWSLVGGRALKDILLEIRQLTITCIVLVTTPQTAADVLHQALQLSMLSHKYSWILPGLNNTEALDLSEYLYTGINITMLNIITEEFNKVIKALKHQRSALDFAVAHDAILTLYHGMNTYQKHSDKCGWSGSPQVIKDTVKKIDAMGATGRLKYTDSMRRETYSTTVLSLLNKRVTRIGRWSSVPGKGQPNLILDNIKLFNYTTKPRLDPLPVRVVTILEAPFVKLKHDYAIREGNDRFEGYCVDLLSKIAEEMNFRYEFYLVPDQKFGAPRDDGSWSGMVGEIMLGNASLAVGPLTINTGRERVIDFTKPFMSLGVSLVMMRPWEATPFFHFTEPLSVIIWILLLAVLVTVSFALFIIERTAPPTENHARMAAGETTWFTFMALVRANCEVVPRTLAGRILSGSLSLFALIIISFYTANLAAFLTVSKLQTSIQGVSDLPRQNKIRYGTVKYSEVGLFFESSNLDIFQQMWTYMSAVEPSNLVETSDEGFQKVLNSSGAYAFIWDSPTVNYWVATNCDLIKVGQPFASKNYGIGVPLGAVYRDQITFELLKMSENGYLEKLRTKWWVTQACPDNTTPRDANRALSLNKIKGVFLVLGAGLVLALMVALVEAVVRKRFFPMHSSKNREKRRDASPSSKPLCDGDSTTIQLQPKLNSCHKSTEDNHDHLDHVKATDIF